MIINRPEDGITSSSDPEEIAQAGLLPQMGMMVRALWASPVRNVLLAASLSLFVIVAATAYGQIRLNSWNQPFYDALSHRNFSEFLKQLGVFGVIAGALLALNVAQRWFGETLEAQAPRRAWCTTWCRTGSRPDAPSGSRMRARSGSIPISVCTRMRAT